MAQWNEPPKELKLRTSQSSGLKPHFSDAGTVERRSGLSCCPYLMGGRLRGLEAWVAHFIRSEG
ncbi:hypothetical protein HUA76_35270 [Myxococcus sp. CA056]|uniref:hypothetical protein n=1 Tax=unclassified Myxococcus TaxID=2648731 RepID=UPI00157AAB4F|nr:MULTISPECIES: hypothetical protein [unclassified Myxococcus]NTX16045.1 hypothetical protein [Myxococcus sp. CA056]NTX40964.1 hypothetical protein [Myxococcus sp. CA033]NTX54557.1 hypothetical protein [Myxococcus sp. CA039A]